MTRTAWLAAALALGASLAPVASALAQDAEDSVTFAMQRSMLTTSVANRLSSMRGIDASDVDVASLTNEQLTQLFLVINGSESQSEKANRIRGILN